MLTWSPGHKTWGGNYSPREYVRARLCLGDGSYMDKDLYEGRLSQTGIDRHLPAINAHFGVEFKPGDIHPDRTLLLPTSKKKK